MAAQRNWLSRNKKWFIPLVLGGPLLMIVFSFGVTAVVTIERNRQSAPYQEALAIARAHPDIQARLGQPIGEGFLINSRYQRLDGVIQSPADVSFRIEGPRGEAGVRARLERVDPNAPTPAVTPESAPDLAPDAPTTVEPGKATPPAPPAESALGAWRVVYLDVGVGDRQTGDVVVLIGDGDAPPQDPDD